MKVNRNTAGKFQHVVTAEGGPAFAHMTPQQELRRTAMACMLWEHNFYENGEDVAARMAALVAKCSPVQILEVISDAKFKSRLRHTPLFLAREMVRLPSHRRYVADVLEAICTRPDDMTDFMAMYVESGKWGDVRLAAQVKKGLARAFTKFTPYQLAKYNRQTEWKLRDILFLCHAKPKDEEQAEVWRQLIAGTLPPPDTWEVAISGGQGAAGWVRLLETRALPPLAFLRNLRNLQEAGLMTQAKDYFSTIDWKKTKLLPWQFLSAARMATWAEQHLDAAMRDAFDTGSTLLGKTTLLVDVSGSMDAKMSQKSIATRLDAACAIAISLEMLGQDVVVTTFSNRLVMVPTRRGMALRDAIYHSQPHAGTRLGDAIMGVHTHVPDTERLVVITDEQSHDAVTAPFKINWMINVGTNKNGVGYGPWKRIDGFSPNIVPYMMEVEDDQVRVREVSGAESTNAVPSESPPAETMDQDTDF